LLYFQIKQSLLGIDLSSNKNFSSETSERYSRAIFELANEKNELEKVEKNIKDLLNIYNFNNDLDNFVKNPTLSIDIQLKALNIFSKSLNFSRLFQNFLSTLAVKRRLFFLKKILQSFVKLSSKNKGELNAQLISSKNLSLDEIKNISNELSSVIGSEISFDYKVDQSLIGGFKMQLGSLLIDTSIKNRLKKYEQIMLEN